MLLDQKEFIGIMANETFVQSFCTEVRNEHCDPILIENEVKKLLYFILILLLGGVFGYGIGHMSQFWNILPPKDDISLWYIVYAFLAFFLALGIHELGHLLTGLAYGFRFYYFTLTFLGIKRDEHDKIKIYFNKDMNAFGGMAATLPSTFDETTTRKFSYVILAGPLISFFAFVLSLFTFQFFNGDIRFLILITGIVSFFIFLSVMIPSRTGMFYTDRKRYQRLTSKGLEKDIEIAYLKSTVHSTLKKPIKDLEESDLILLTKDESSLFRYIGYYFLYEYHLGNQQKLEEVRNEMKLLESEIPTSMVKAMNVELEKL